MMLLLKKFFWWTVCWLTVPLYEIGIYRPGIRAYERYERAAMAYEDWIE